ncbi:MAG: hypothetical protein ACK5MZ_09170 [Aestuariibaculum sp.]
MKIFLITYFTTTLGLSIFHLSLLAKKKWLWLAVFIPGLVTLGFYPFSIAQNNQTMDWLLGQDNLVSGVAILLTFEAIAVIALTVVQIKSYYKLKFPELWKWISIIPPLQLILVLIFFQTYLFIQINGTPFIVLAFGFMVCSSLILFVLAFLVQTLFKKWEHRAELKALTALFQLLLAMFLPLMARGQSVAFTQITIDYFAILFTLLLIVIIAGLGYWIYKKKKLS